MSRAEFSVQRNVALHAVCGSGSDLLIGRAVHPGRAFTQRGMSPVL